MARVCQVTGKRPKVANHVSHAQNKSKRRMLPNLHVRRLWFDDEKRFVQLRLSARGLRTVEKRGLARVVGDLRKQGVRV